MSLILYDCYCFLSNGILLMSQILPKIIIKAFNNLQAVYLVMIDIQNPFNDLESRYTQSLGASKFYYIYMNSVLMYF